MRLHYLIALSLYFWLSGAFAASYESDLLVLDIPDGFQGPKSQSMDQGGTVAFGKPHPGSQTNTLLQISTFELGPKASELTPQELADAADRYVLEFLSGVERRRDLFSSTKPTRVLLAGRSASRVTWKGKAQGHAMHGVMYCVIVGSHVISLHTQDFDAAPPSYLQEAESAIRSIKLKGGG